MRLVEEQMYSTRALQRRRKGEQHSEPTDGGALKTSQKNSSRCGVPRKLERFQQKFQPISRKLPHCLQPQSFMKEELKVSFRMRVHRGKSSGSFIGFLRKICVRAKSFLIKLLSNCLHTTQGVAFI